MNATTNQQYLTFSLNGDLYGVPVARVREVVSFMKVTKITRLPKSESYLRGIMDRRGTGIPVMDLRKRFGFPEVEESVDTTIIVIEGKNSAAAVGIMADAVHEVVQIPETATESAPKFGTGVGANYIRCIGKKDGEFVIILDIDSIVEMEVVFGN